MARVRPTLFLALLGAATPLPAASAQGIRPGSLLVYYGYPTSINMSFSVPAAAGEFGRYDHVVWGDGLDSPAHPDHANAVAILAHSDMAATRVYGQVDLGVSTQNLPMAEVEARIARWDAMGVEGVMLDNFGYDFGTGRARQNAAVDYAHAQGLAVIANAFRPEDAFGSDVDAVHNPGGTPAHLGPADGYLYESHAVRLDTYEDAAVWQAKADALEAYRASFGFKVLSITSTATDDVGAYDEPHFFYAWYAALLYGHEATGWGEYGYSASGSSNGLAPFRTRPTLDPGSAFIGGVTHNGSLHLRRTDLGRIEIDSAAHTYGFSPQSVGVPAMPEPVALMLAAAPNPVHDETRFAFTLQRPQTVRLVVYAVGGGRIATVADRDFAAGPQELAWSGRDYTGRRVAPGIYFAALQAEDGLSVARLVVLP